MIRTGDSNGADRFAVSMRSTTEAARIPVTAAVELSGAAIAKGRELPSATTAASTAELTKVAVMP
ncbi:hypothetical protein ACVWWO_004864 [Bradyrhizobium sp. F1.13.1]